MSAWWSAHTHSHYSVKDGMSPVPRLVETAARHGQPALGLTDHGLMSGVVQLYQTCRKHGLAPFPGIEAYVVTGERERRYHLGLLALDYKGYGRLVRLTSLSHRRDRYWRKPLLTLQDLQEAELGPHVAVLTGCFFGLPSQLIAAGNVDGARRALQALAGLAEHVFVEVQHHHTHHDGTLTDTDLAVTLSVLATELGLPVVTTQDAHYCERSEKEVHDLMKRLTIFSGPDTGDVSFPGDSYHLANGLWVKGHYAAPPLHAVWNAGLEGLSHLLELNRMSFPALDSYRFHVPRDISDRSPQEELEWLCRTDQVPVGGRRILPGHRERLDYELEVIRRTGFAGYFLLVRRIVQWCRSQDISVSARGSANGSLVCWVLGITNVDPLMWGLDFDRFLTADRVTPPDIDLDIEDSRRDEVIEWLSTQWEVCQLGTFSLMTVDAADRGSVVQAFSSFMAKQTGNRHVWNVKADMGTVERHAPEFVGTLRQLGATGALKNSGGHASGYALGTEEQPLEGVVPTMLIPSSGATVTQFTMDDVEALGFVKVDLLGSRTLSTLSMVSSLTGVDPDTIPLDDPETMAMLRKGDTVGVFQLEGWTARKGCREMKVSTTEDIVRLLALYRPATINSGYKDQYLNNRARGWEASHPVLQDHLGPTHGVALFQEQVLAIMRSLGMPSAELNRILKAVKVKHGVAGMSEASTRAFEEARQSFDAMVGLDKQTRDEVWSLIEGFAAYGFNRAHAVAYGLIAYRMAWFKCHHTLDFMLAALSTTLDNPDLQKLYTDEARRCGFRVLPPCVNTGGANWTKRGRSLVKGLATVKGVGFKAAWEIERQGPYASLGDLVARTDGRVVTGGKDIGKGKLKGVLLALAKAGALKDLGVDRWAL